MAGGAFVKQSGFSIIGGEFGENTMKFFYLSFFTILVLFLSITPTVLAGNQPYFFNAPLDGGKQISVDVL